MQHPLQHVRSRPDPCYEELSQEHPQSSGEIDRRLAKSKRQTRLI